MTRALRSVSIATYFGYTGWLVAAVVGVWFMNQATLAANAWMLTRELLATALVTAIVFIAGLAPFLPVIERYASRLQRLGTWTSRFGCFAYAATALYLLRTDHRIFVVVIALLQAAAIYSIRARTTKRLLGWIVAVSVMPWALASGIPYTHLGDWLIGASGSTALALPVFVLAFALVLFELTQQSRKQTRRWSVATFVAILVFAAYALRTDGLFAYWYPFDRSYFADVAQYVHDGHWLLWDVPSLYGFLSMIILSLLAGSNGYQAVYELVAAILFGECLMAFFILRSGRKGWLNATFSIAFPLAMIFAENLTLYPTSARLYPQGGLRFFWIDALVFIAFLLYTNRANNLRVRLLRIIGHAIWLISLFWSIESAGWGTAIWIPYLLIEMFVDSRRINALSPPMLAERFAPIFILPALALLAVDAIYRFALGVHADWLAYVQGVGLFVVKTINPLFWVQTLGAGWEILLVLGALGALGVALLRSRRLDAVPLVAAAWLAVWTTASYYAVEPLDDYVMLLLGVSILAISVLIFVTRDAFGRRPFAQMLRYSIAPIAILAVAFAFGGPSRLAAMRLPISRGWSFNALAHVPALPRELALLMHRAGISPRDKVLIPISGYWTELDQGLILPFDRDSNGHIVQYHSWLPISPNGLGQLADGLSAEQRQLMIDRTLARHPSLGWYITYRSPSDCSALSSALVSARTVTSRNFSASLCVYRASPRP